MGSFFRLLPFIGAVIFAVISQVDCDVDLVTSRAAVKITSEETDWSCSGTLISSNLVYTGVHCIYWAATESRLLNYTLMDGTRSRKVKKVFYPPEYEKNWNRSLTCDDVENKCVEECLQGVDRKTRGDLLYNYALILLEEPFPLCEKEGDPVAARLDTTPFNHNLKSLIGDSGEECFMVNADGEVAIYSDIYPYVNKTHPECTSRMVEFQKADKSDYQKPIDFKTSYSTVQCNANSGKNVKVRFLSTLYMGEQYPDQGLQTSRHAAELLAVIARCGEHDNYMHSHNKCDAFLRKYPYGSIKGKYLKNRRNNLGM